ncbi:MAG TPA: DJ-1/PfpI family protein, partial [Rubrivivax sp.]|nr:DJ-1/PfpI family protein [Rubrivivax sp.]
GGVRTRKVAILVADGVVGASVAAVQAALLDAGAVPKVVAPRLGAVSTTDGVALQADGSFENSPAVLFDAVVLADGEAAGARLAALGQATEFMVNQYRHCKTILALGSSAALLPMFGVAATLPSGEADPGVLADSDGDAIAQFIHAVGQHRHPARESDPPAV